MGDLASMMYGTAQNAAQEQGQGLPQAVATGAELAAKQQTLDLQKQQMGIAMQNLTMEKFTRVGQSWDAAAKMQPGSMRDAFIKNFIPKQTEAMGLQGVYDPTVSQMLAKEPQISAVVHAGVLNGTYDPGILSQADKLAKMYPELQTIASAEDISKVAVDQNVSLMKEYQENLQRQEKTREDQLNRENTLAAAHIRATGAGQVMKPGDVTAAQKNQEAQLAPLTKKQDDVGPMLDARDRVLTSLQKNPSGSSVMPQDLSAVLFPLLHSALGRVTEVEISKTLNMPGLAGLTQQQLTDKLVGGVNPNAAKAILQWADDSAKNIDQKVMDRKSSIEKATNAMPNRTPEEKAALLAGLPDLAKPVFRPRPGASSTVMVDGKSYDRAKVQQILKDNPNDPKAPLFQKALAGGQ